MENMKIAAGIVVFNPQKDRLIECINQLREQVECIILYDNSTVDNSISSTFDNVIYMTSHTNIGIASALNKIFIKGKDLGFDWILTMDQDTIVPSNLISEFSKYLNEKDVAIVCPQVVDKRRVYLKTDIVDSESSEIDFCITSASCTNLQIWDSVGRFDDFLFIDFVDNDFCKRLKLAGKKILRCNKVVIDQEFGDIELKTTFWVNFYLSLSKLLHNINIAKLTYRKNVSPFRVYYVHRNLIYLNKKFKKYGGIGYDNFYCHSFLGFLLYFSLPSFIRGQKKIKIFKAIIGGLYDGYKSQVTIIN